MGMCDNGRVRTNFSVTHLHHTPPQFNHLSGLLDIFKSKLVREKYPHTHTHTHTHTLTHVILTPTHTLYTQHSVTHSLSLSLSLSLSHTHTYTLTHSHSRTQQCSLTTKLDPVQVAIRYLYVLRHWSLNDWPVEPLGDIDKGFDSEYLRTLRVGAFTDPVKSVIPCSVCSVYIVWI